MFTIEELADYLRTSADQIDEANVEQLKREARVKLRRAAPRLPEDERAWPEAANVVATVSYTHLTLPTNREV